MRTVSAILDFGVKFVRSSLSKILKGARPNVFPSPENVKVTISLFLWGRGVCPTY